VRHHLLEPVGRELIDDGDLVQDLEGQGDLS
jgi:hypothetical protein